MAPRLGDRLGDRYRLLELIGRGGMGSVYQARDELLWRDVALKLFDRSVDEKDVQRQEDEVNVLAGLNHHGLVSLLDAAIDRTEPGHPRIYFVMELVQGTDLERRIEAGRLSGRKVAQIGYDLAEALQYIHHRGVTHRDIKPSNVLLVDYRDDSARTRAKLSDFGIALVARNSRMTGEGLTTGTAAYLSPEQVAKQPVGPATDIYSLGLVLLECFTRQLAFEGDPIASAIARLHRDPEIPRWIPASWRDLFTVMTARNPLDRPESGELVSLMRRAVIVETGRHRRREVEDPAVESARLDAVRLYDVFASPIDETFDRITAIAARVFDVPVSIVSIVDEEHILFKSHHGLDFNRIERTDGLCASAILADTPRIIEDARFDPRALSNPLVAGEFGLQFYAGVPLITGDGYRIGTLCVLDFEPRTVSEQQIATLTDLSNMVMVELEKRLGRPRALLPETEPVEIEQGEIEQVAIEQVDNVTTLIPRRWPALTDGEAEA